MTNIKFNSTEKNQFLKKFENQVELRLHTSVIVNILGDIEEKADKAIDTFTMNEVDEAFAELRSSLKSELSFKCIVKIIQNFLSEQKINSLATKHILNLDLNAFA